MKMVSMNELQSEIQKRFLAMGNGKKPKCLLCGSRSIGFAVYARDMRDEDKGEETWVYCYCLCSRHEFKKGEAKHSQLLKRQKIEKALFKVDPDFKVVQEEMPQKT